jgi:hypothetical protein
VVDVAAAGFPLRPRRPEVPALVAIFGLVLLVAGAFTRGGARLVNLGCGIGLLLAIAAFGASPLWRSALVVDDDGCVVRGPRGDRLRIAWSDVRRVLVDDAEGTCWVDGGEGKRLLVPSRGMASSYVIRGHAEATRAIAGHVPDRVRRVEKLSAEAVERALHEGPASPERA